MQINPYPVGHLLTAGLQNFAFSFSILLFDFLEFAFPTFIIQDTGGNLLVVFHVIQVISNNAFTTSIQQRKHGLSSGGEMHALQEGAHALHTWSFAQMPKIFPSPWGKALQGKYPTRAPPHGHLPSHGEEASVHHP